MYGRHGCLKADAPNTLVTGARVAECCPIITLSYSDCLSLPKTNMLKGVEGLRAGRGGPR